MSIRNLKDGYKKPDLSLRDYTLIAILTTTLNDPLCRCRRRPDSSTDVLHTVSALGVPAVVTIGNTLTMQFSRTMLTPMYHLGGWAFKEMASNQLTVPAMGIVNHAKTIIKHGSPLDTEDVREQLIKQLDSGFEHNVHRIIDKVSRITINDDTYDLLRA